VIDATCLEGAIGELMNFEYDAFISYSQVDNEPLQVGAKGWVDQFHEALNTCLIPCLGRRPNIWRDPELKGSDVFPTNLVERLRQDASLVAVVLKSYLNSDCQCCSPGI
jgi:hypothetical protein